MLVQKSGSSGTPVYNEVETKPQMAHTVLATRRSDRRRDEKKQKKNGNKICVHLTHLSKGSPWSITTNVGSGEWVLRRLESTVPRLV
jgi:hypothetical protein